MAHWFTMDERLECSNCGIEGDRYTMVESVRRCGTGHGEWYCVDGLGCQADIEKPISTFDTPKDALAAVVALSMQSLRNDSTDGGER
jgi:hypothetical protein